MSGSLARLVTCLTLAGLFAYSRRPAPPDLSSPKATLRSFVAAIKQKDPAALVACVDGAKDTPEKTNILTSLMAGGAFDIKEPIAEINGDTARVAVEIDASDEMAKTIMLMDSLELKKEADGWKIVPDRTMLKSFLENRSPAQKTLPVLKLYAAIAGGSDDVMQAFRDAQGRAKGVACVSNGKQMALAAIQYAQDYDEQYPPKSASFKDLIMPYIKNEAVFTCPLDPPGTQSYSYNKYMQGRSLATITDISKTILQYEGKDMTPDYRHDGKAMITFADGHSRLCGPEEVKGLVWKEADWKEILPVKPTPKSKGTTKKKKPTGKA